MGTAFEQMMAGTAYAKPQGSVEAPELGDGERVHFLGLGIGAAFRMNMLKEEGKDGLSIARELFPLCVCNVDGKPFFNAGQALTEDQQRAIDAVPLTLVMRVVDAATRSMKTEGDAAKKPSAETPGSAS